MSHISDPNLDAAAHPEGEGDDGNGGLGSIIGQTIILPDGSYWTVSANPNPVTNIAPGFFADQGAAGGLPPTFRAEDLTVTNVDTGESAPFTDIAAGKWVLQNRTEVVADEQGNITSTRKLTAKQWDDYLAGAGGGGGGGGGTGGGAAAPLPNVIGTANAWMNYYETQVRNGLMERTQAMEDYNRKMLELNTMIDVEIAQGTFDQTAAIAENTAQGVFDANTLRQQEEFGRRSGSFVRDFLPNFMPGLTGVNVPGVGGTFPVPQVNADQIYGLPALAAAGPTQPVPIPSPQLTQPDFSQFPQVPGYTPPPIPNIPALLGQQAGISLPV